MSKSNCSDFEQLIALYVEEDLSGPDRGRVEVHLHECSSCWDLAEDLKESQAMFKSIREDVPDATALSVVRERVLSEVDELHSMTWFERFVFAGLRRKAALASIALLIVGSGALWLVRGMEDVPAPPVFVVVPPVPDIQPEAPVSAPAPILVRRRVPEPPPVLVAEAAPKEKEERKQVAIKFLTDDPNIIIYWLVDEKGD
jgi:anti-sigma factor RsiW